MKKLNPSNPKRKIFNRRRLQFAYTVLLWHGRLGIAVALFLLILLTTGIALNHTERLSLDETYISNEWLLDWYGFTPERDPISYKTDQYWITEIDGKIFLDSKLIMNSAKTCVGALVTTSMLVIASVDALFLFDQEGILIEKITTIPGAIRRLGELDGDTYIDTATGIFATDENFIVWEPTISAPNWILDSPLPEQIEQSVLEAYRGTGLPLERIILDLHSGRIVGTWGPYLMDAAAIVLLILAISGFYNWTIRR